ncbi:MAG: hypothetical protein DRN27_05320 [Thermoplasmata archaeon]|nr:MAG: hypothetical protein DRN27_05320 [Thermoplasmata archaeon]
MAKNYKQKGNRVEREACKILTEWYGEEFHRMAQSGGIRWNDTHFTFGDLVPPSDFSVIIEVKGRPSAGKKLGVDWDFLLRHSKSEIENWWDDQLSDDIKRAYELTDIHFTPILLIKINNVGWRIIISQKTDYFIQMQWNAMHINDNKARHKNNIKPLPKPPLQLNRIILERYDKDNLMIYNLQDILQKIPFKYLKKALCFQSV